MFLHQNKLSLILEMDKATKFVLIPFRDFRLLTCKRKINSKGRISGIVKEIELSDDENEIKKSKGASG